MSMPLRDGHSVAADSPPSGRIDLSDRPATSLLRWDRHRDLRDRVLEYARRQGTSTHAVLIDTIRRGLAQIEDGNDAHTAGTRTRDPATDQEKNGRRRGDIVIEVTVHGD